MDGKFTNETWEVDAVEGENVVGVSTSCGDPVCEMYRAIDGWTLGKSTTREWKLARARLIAAAPDLLEACDTALAFVAAWAGVYQHDNGMRDFHPKHAEAINQIKAAIAKATQALEVEKR